MAKDTRLIADQIIEAAKVTPSARGGVRSEIYRVMWEEYDKLVPVLNGPIAPNWPEVAKRMMASGVKDGRGKPPTAVTVRKTWAKVTDDKAKGTTDRRHRRKGSAEMPVALSPPSTSRSKPTALDDDEVEITPFKIRSKTGDQNGT